MKVLALLLVVSLSVAAAFSPKAPHQVSVSSTRLHETLADKVSEQTFASFDLVLRINGLVLLCVVEYLMTIFASVRSDRSLLVSF
jgi:hypothetical protein